MAAPDPGLTDLIAAHTLRVVELNEAVRYPECNGCDWVGGLVTDHAAHLASVVEQHTNGRTTELEAEQAADEMQIQSFDVKDGVLNLKMSPGGTDSEAVLLAMSDAMGELLDKHDATNYVEFDLHKRGRPAFSVCVRRFHRPTPHDLRMQAEARAEKAEATATELETELEKYRAEEREDLEWQRFCAQQDVRCTECGLRYGERKDYACPHIGDHTYDANELRAALEGEQQ